MLQRKLPTWRTLSSFAMLLGVGLLAGCVSSGPKSEPALHEAIIRAIGKPELTGIIGTGNWLPNAQGYAVLKSTTLVSQVGIIAVAGDHIWFLQWNDTQERFNVLKSVSYVNAKQVFLDKLGHGRMLVIQSQDSTFDSFEFANGFGLGNSERAEQAYALISKEREKH